MNANDYWQIFMDTGAPEVYLLFKAMQTEGTDVSDDPGGGTESNGLQ